MNIVFMGSPEFAVPVLKSLHQSEHTILAVVTVPDHWGGRNKQQRLESAVKRYALDQKIELLQPTNLKNKQFAETLRLLNPDIIVVVAFKILPKSIWSIPRYGTINLHASLLPAYRGAAPINHAVIQGEKVTGMTTFYIDKNIDTGEILLQETVPIYDDDTAGDVYERMMKTSGSLVLKTLNGIESNEIIPFQQDPHKISLAPKVFFDKNELDFNQSTKRLYNFIRGMSPYPGTWTKYLGKILKIYFASPVRLPHDEIPGTIKTDYSTYFRIYTRDGYLNIRDMQWEGKKRMKVKDFINGLKRPD